MDNKIIVGIHQPNFAPWLGYFYKIHQADVFIFLDDVQIQKKGASYTNRVSINSNGKAQFLTIQIKRGEGVNNINTTEFFNDIWQIKMLKTIQANYAKAPFYKENIPFIEELMLFKATDLADFNMNFIVKICERLNINTELRLSSEFNIQEASTLRLIKLIQSVQGNVYLSGKGGDNYQDHDMYENENIELIYNDLPNFEYPQVKTDTFVNGLSIIDSVFNINFAGIETFFNKNNLNGI
jgi:hypothetical protein